MPKEFNCDRRSFWALSDPKLEVIRRYDLIAGLSVAAIRSKVSVLLHSGRGYPEGFLTLWFLVMGVNADALKAQAAVNGE